MENTIFDNLPKIGQVVITIGIILFFVIRDIKGKPYYKKQSDLSREKHVVYLNVKNEKKVS